MRREKTKTILQIRKKRRGERNVEEQLRFWIGKCRREGLLEPFGRGEKTWKRGKSAPGKGGEVASWVQREPIRGRIAVEQFASRKKKVFSQKRAEVAFDDAGQGKIKSPVEEKKGYWGGRERGR